MKVKVLIVNGRPRSGKDTMCDILNNICIQNDIYYCGISSVQLMKDALKMLGWDGVTKGIQERKLLSDMKKYTINHDPHMINNKIIEQITNGIISTLCNGCIFTIMIREPSEIIRFIDDINAIFYHTIDISTVLIHRDNVNIDNGVSSDDHVFEYDYDYIIHNNDTLDDLKDTTLSLYNDIMEG